MFLFYARNGNLQEVDKLLAAGVDPDVRDQSRYNEGETALMKAVLNDDMPMIRRLIEAGADVNAVDRRNESALLVAAMTGNLRLVRFLVERGARVSLASFKGYTPLLVAADRGHLPVIEYLVSRGASVKETTGNGFTAVMAASKYYSNVMEYFIRAGVDVNARTDTGVTALMVAAAANNEESMKILLKHHAQVSYRTDSGVDAIRYSFYFLRPESSPGQNDLLKAMMDRCVQERPCLQKEFSPAYLVIETAIRTMYPVSDEVLKKIFSTPGMVNQKSKEGYTPLDLALAFQDFPGLERLIANLRKQGAVSTIDEKSLLLHRWFLNEKWEKIKEEATGAELEKFREFISFSDDFYPYHNKYKLASLYRDKGIVFDHSHYNAIYVKKCEELGFHSFDEVLFGSAANHENDAALEKLKSCPLDFTRGYFQEKLKRPRDESFSVFQNRVYDFLGGAVSHYRSGFEAPRDAYHIMIDFLVKSKFSSTQKGLFRGVLLYNTFFSYDAIASIENIREDFDRKGNNAYHFLFAMQDVKRYDVYEVNLARSYRRNNQYQSYEVFDWLLTVHPGFDRPNHAGVTPLMLACRYGLYYMAQRLLKEGASVSQRDLKNRNASDYALLNGYDSILALFPEAVAKASRNKYWQLQRDIVAGKDSDRFYMDFSTQSYLKRRGLPIPGYKEPEPLDYDDLDRCAMTADVESENIEAVSWWLQQGYSANCRESFMRWPGVSLIDVAIRQENAELLELLLENGARNPLEGHETYLLERNDQKSLKLLEILRRYSGKEGPKK